MKLIKELVSNDSSISRIYGFILYTRKDPYIAKVLADPFFWNALDEISGSNWPIFAARPLNNGKYIVEGSTPNTISMLVSTWSEPSANEGILRDFGLDNSKSLPLFIAFMWDDNDELNEIAIPIHGDTADSVYHSLELIIRTISYAEANILPKYKRTINVFRNVAADLSSLEYKIKLIKRGKITYDIAEFLKTFI